MTLREKLIRKNLKPAGVEGAEGCFIRVWSEREQIEHAVYCQTGEKTAGFEADIWLRCKVIASCLCDADGNSVFDSHEQAAELDSEMLDRLFMRACEVQSRKAADDDAKKNSMPAQP